MNKILNYQILPSMVGYLILQWNGVKRPLLEIQEMLINADDDNNFEGAKDEDSDEDTSMDD